MVAVFSYSPAHDVVEVSKADYDACTASKVVARYTGGKTTVKLTTAGKRYFICSITGHCDAGMKVEVNVKSKEVRTVQRCRRTGNRRRCQSETVLSSATSAGVDQSTVARLGLIVVAAGLMLFF